MAAKTEAIKLILEEEQLSLSPRKSLAEEAAAAIRELILLDKLKPGMPIPERDLADAVGISRTPLREAMRLLEVEGLIEYSKTRRPRVADPTLNELSQNLAVLGALEGLAGALACELATDAQIDEVEALNNQMFDTSDTANALDFFKTDMTFHQTIVALSQNEPLMETHRQYNARLWRARFISSRRRPDRPGTLRQHNDIVDALKQRNKLACSRALQEHLKTAISNIEKSLSEQNK